MFKQLVNWILHLMNPLKSHNLKTKQKPYSTFFQLFLSYRSGIEFNLLWLEVCPASTGILTSLRALISAFRICAYVCTVCQEWLRLVQLVNESAAILMWKAGAVGQMSYYCCSPHTHTHSIAASKGIASRLPETLLREMTSSSEERECAERGRVLFLDDFISSGIKCWDV